MTGKILHDSETQAKGQQVITACAFIHKNVDGVEKVFLPRRAPIKKFLPNAYELPGGHINFGEDMLTGLEREIMEEFRMRIKIGDPFNVFTYGNDVKGSHSIEVDYFASFVDPEDKIVINPDDHSEYRWFSEEEFTENVVPTREDKNDPEFKAIYRAFALLNGKKLDFGI